MAVGKRLKSKGRLSRMAGGPGARAAVMSSKLAVGPTRFGDDDWTAEMGDVAVVVGRSKPKVLRAIQPDARPKSH